MWRLLAAGQRLPASPPGAAAHAAAGRSAEAGRLSRALRPAARAQDPTPERPADRLVGGSVSPDRVRPAHRIGARADRSAQGVGATYKVGGADGEWVAVARPGRVSGGASTVFTEVLIARRRFSTPAAVPAAAEGLRLRLFVPALLIWAPLTAPVDPGPADMAHSEGPPRTGVHESRISKRISKSRISEARISNRGSADRASANRGSVYRGSVRRIAVSQVRVTRTVYRGSGWRVGMPRC